MTEERNKYIACLVLQGRTYDSVEIEYNISRERVYQITRRICERIVPGVAHDYSIKELRKDCDRLISKIWETNVSLNNLSPFWQRFLFPFVNCWPPTLKF